MNLKNIYSQYVKGIKKKTDYGEKKIDGGE